MPGNDFYIRFGSNMDKFAERLHQQVNAPNGPKATIKALQAAMNQLDARGREILPPLTTALAKTARAGNAATEATGGGTGGGGTGGGGGGGVSDHYLHSLADDMRREMETITTALAGVVRTLDSTTKAFKKTQNRVEGWAGREPPYVHPKTGVILGSRKLGITNEEAAAATPGAYRQGQKFQGQDFTSLLTKAMATQHNVPLPAPGSIGISALSKVQIDEGGFDRVVKAVNEVQATLERMSRLPVASEHPAAEHPAPEHPVAPVAPVAPAAHSPKETAHKVESVTSQIVADIQATEKAVEIAADDLEGREAALEKEIAHLGAELQQMAALLANLGDIVPAEIKEMVANLSNTQSQAKAQLAEVQRKKTGETYAERRARRREEYEASRGPDLIDEEYDKRKEHRRILALPAHGESFLESIGTGKGQRKRSDLKDISDVFEQYGFPTGINSKTSAPDMGAKIIAARKDFEKEYGSSFPEELDISGKRIVPDRISPEVQKILGQENEAVQLTVKAAREVLKTAAQTGHLPKDPTLRETGEGLGRTTLLASNEVPSLGFAWSEEIKEAGEAASRYAAQALGKGPTIRDTIGEMTTTGGSAVRVPTGMVKGGEYNDVFGIYPAQALLKARAFEKARTQASDSSFNPFTKEVAQGVTGKGETARSARRDLAEVREATEVLDTLGTQFKVFSDALALNHEFVERASHRLSKADEDLTPEQREKVKTDPAKREAALANIDRLQKALSAPGFTEYGKTEDTPGVNLTELFSSPEYQTGLKSRRGSLAERRAALEAQAVESENRNRVNLAGAAGTAIVGTRLAAGTKDTYIRKLPGVRFSEEKRSFSFLDDQDDPTKLTALNQKFKAYVGKLRHAMNLEEDFNQGLDVGDKLEHARDVLENRVASFLKEIDKVFGKGVAPALESLVPKRQKDELGYPAWLGYGTGEGSYEYRNEDNQTAEERRRAAAEQQRGVTFGKVTNRTPEQALEQQYRGLEDVTARQTQVAEKQTEITEKRIAAEAAVIAAEHKVEAALTDEQKAFRDAAVEARKAAEAEVYSLDTKLIKLDPNRTRLKASAKLDAALARKEALEKGGGPEDSLASVQAIRPAGPGFGTDINTLDLEVGKREKDDELGYPAWLGYGIDKGSHQSEEQRRVTAAEREAAVRAKIAKEDEEIADLRAKGAVSSKDPASVSTLYKQIDAERKLAQVRARELHVTEYLLAEDFPDQQREAANAATDAARALGDLRAQERVLETETLDLTTAAARFTANISHMRSELEGVSSAVPVGTAAEGPTPAGAERPVRDPEIDKSLDRLHKQRDAQSAQRAKATKLQEDLRRAKARNDDAEIARLQVELDEVRKQGIPSSTAARTLRKKIQALEAKQTRTLEGEPGHLGLRQHPEPTPLEPGAPTPPGGTPPPAPPHGGSPPHPGTPGGGFSPETNNILRDILSAVNAVNKTLTTGVRITGGGAGKAVRVDANGNPVERKQPVSTTRASGEELRAIAAAKKAGLDPSVIATGNDDASKALAKAQAAQRRRQKEFDKAGGNLERAQTQAIVEHAAAVARDERALAKNTAASRAEAREQQAVAIAMGLVSDEARAELTALRQLNAAGASAVAITEQQAKAYYELDRALKKQGVKPADRRRMGQSLLSDANVRPDGTQGPRLTGAETSDVARSARTYGGLKSGFKQAAQEADEGSATIQEAISKRLFGNSGFWSRIMGSTGAFVVRNFTAGFVFGLTNGLQEVIAEGIKAESTFIRVSDALEQTGRSSGNLRTELQGVASQYGTSLNDVYETAAGLTGLFETPHEIAGATKVVSQLQAISMGALNASEATGVLASITGAYTDELGTSVDSMAEVADVMTVIQNEMGVNIETTSEGLGAMAGLAKQLKIPYQDAAVYVAQIAKLTNQTGAGAGEALSRITASMQSGRSRAALTKALPGTGIDSALASGDYGSALKILLGNWDGLSEAQQRNLAVTIAGQRQMRSFTGLVHGASKTLETAARAHDAQGQAAARAEKIANTLNGQIARLGSNLVVLADNVANSGLLDFLMLFLKAANGALSGFNKLTGSISELTKGNPLLQWFKHITLGILGFVGALKLGAAAYAGFRASLNVIGTGEAVATGAGAATTAGRQSSKQIIANMFGGAGNILGNLGDRYERKGSRFGQGGLMDDAAGKEVSKTSRVYGLAAKSANGASRSMARLSTSIAALGSMGMGANLGILVLVAALGAGIAQMFADAKRNKEFSDLLATDRTFSKYGVDTSGKRLTKEEEEKAKGKRPYVGKFTSGAEENYKKTTTTSSGALYAGVGFGGEMATNLYKQVTHPKEILGWPKDWKNRLDRYLEDYKATQQDPNASGFAKVVAGTPLSWFADVEHTSLGRGAKRRAGILPDEQVSRIADLGSRAQELLSPLTIRQAPELKKFGAQGIPPSLMSPQLYEDKQVQHLSGKELAAAAKKRQAEIQKDLSKEYQKILKSDDSKQQKQRAIADLEAIWKSTTEKVNAALLFAQGVSAMDKLSLQQIKEIDSLRGLYQQTAVSGDVDARDKTLGPIFDRLLKDTNVRKGSKIGKALKKLSEGGLNKSDALILDEVPLDEEIKQINAQIKASESGSKVLDDQELDDLKQQLISKLAEKAQSTENILAAFIDESNTISEAAINFGQYPEAIAALERGVTRYHRRRNRAKESPEVRARRDNVESEQAEKIANTRSEEKNERLQTLKSRSQNSVKDAQYDAQIAQNAYAALLQSKKEAEAAGRKGPPMKAIHEAERAAIESSQAAAEALSSASIAQMAVRAAGIWNETAAAAYQEKIALAQLAAAKKTGDPEKIANAQVGVITARHGRITQRQQQEQAARDAQIARIPQGNTVAVQRAQLNSINKQLRDAKKLGTESVTYQGLLQQKYSLQQEINKSQDGIAQAQAALAQAYAEARGDAVGAARAGIAIARAALAEARKSGDKVAILNAQAQLVAANAAYNASLADLVQSRVAVGVAIADAAGNTVRSAALQLQGARIALATALKKSGGKHTAEVNAARASVITSRAASRDAVLQDRLDTIDFNLQMGRITQSSAIAALQQILKTSNLTKQQRRDLLLKIKGMKDEIANDQWNFGDIKLPKPYEMRRYIQHEKDKRAAMIGNSVKTAVEAPGTAASHTVHNQTTIQINGADVAKVRKVVEEVVGRATRTRTTQSRRR